MGSVSSHWWKGTPLTSIWRGTEREGVALHLGHSANKLDSQHKRVIDDQGTAYTFDKLLLATGGTPRRLPFGAEQIIYFRTLADYRRLHALADQGQRFAVIGGGFIGSEVAAALAMNGKEVVLLFPGDGIGGHMFPRELSQFLNGFYREQGVEVWTGELVTGLEAHGDRIAVNTRGRQDIVVDGVVAGIGIQPNVELAQTAGLEVGNGIVVDESLRTSHRDIYAAGDVAAFYNSSLGERLRVEHE